MALLITDNDVRELLSIGDAIDAAETALKDLQSGAAANLPRHHFYQEHESGTFFMRHFQGAVPSLGVAGMRLTTDALGGNVHRPDLRPFGMFLLFELRSAALLAVLHDHELQRLRVGAETGVGIRYLARPDASTVAVLGAGFQAETQLAAACAERKIRSADVYSRSEAPRNGFAEKMQQRLGIPVRAVSSAREAVFGKDLVLAATNSSVPVLDGAWIQAGAHVTSIVNSDRRFPRRELDDRTLERACVVVIGYLEQTRLDHAADIYRAIESGALSWDRICDLGEVLVGKRTARSKAEDITVFKNNGLAVEFVALAAKVHQLARRRGRGQEIPNDYFSGLRSPGRSEK